MRCRANGDTYYGGAAKLLTVSAPGGITTYQIYGSDGSVAYAVNGNGELTDYSANSGSGTSVNLITSGSMNYNLGQLSSTGNMTLKMDYDHASLIDCNDSGTPVDNIVSGGDFTLAAKTAGSFGTAQNPMEVNVAGDTRYQDANGDAVAAIESYIKVAEGNTLTIAKDTLIRDVAIYIQGEGDLAGDSVAVTGTHGILDVNVRNVTLGKLGLEDGSCVTVNAAGSMVAGALTVKHATATIQVVGDITVHDLDASDQAALNLNSTTGNLTIENTAAITNGSTANFNVDYGTIKNRDSVSGCSQWLVSASKATLQAAADITIDHLRILNGSNVVITSLTNAGGKALGVDRKSVV